MTLFFKLDDRRSPIERCVGFEDGLDGFVVHDPRCSNAGRSWVSSSTCINYFTWHGYWPDWAREEKP